MSWHDRTACGEMDPRLFFVPDDEPGAERAAREAEAKAVCVLCPVRLECLDYALRNSIKYGIWGGLSQAERMRERRRRAHKPKAA